MSDFKIVSWPLSPPSTLEPASPPPPNDSGLLSTVAAVVSPWFSWLTGSVETSAAVLCPSEEGSVASSGREGFELVTGEEEDENGVESLAGSSASSPELSTRVEAEQIVPESSRKKTKKASARVLTPTLTIQERKQKLKVKLTELKEAELKITGQLQPLKKQHATATKRRNLLQSQIKAGRAPKGAQAERILLWSQMSKLADQMQRLEKLLAENGTKIIATTQRIRMLPLLTF